jgi:hypothetical protein
MEVPVADTLLQDAQDLENKALAFAAADQKAQADAATAASSAQARSQAHVDLQSAIAKVIGDAQALDPSAQAPAPSSAAPAA